MFASVCCLWAVVTTTTPVPGFMVLDVCSQDPSDNRGKVYVDPVEVSAIFQARDAPKGCVKILFANGRGIFVHGSEHEVAEKRNTALREKYEMD